MYLLNRNGKKYLLGDGAKKTMIHYVEVKIFAERTKDELS